jgi:hypothetical protein
MWSACVRRAAIQQIGLSRKNSLFSTWPIASQAKVNALRRQTARDAEDVVVGDGGRRADRGGIRYMRRGDHRARSID